jgi:amidase
MTARPPRIYSTLLVIVAGLSACSDPDPPSATSDRANYSVVDVPLHRISEDLAAGRTTAVEITEAYIARIEAMDGPLNSIIAVAPDALEQAAASDARRQDGEERSELDGVPILLKDNLDATGMPTTAGSWALENNYPVADSEVARRFRAAGVVILGKANLSQFAGFRNSPALNGSTLGGGTHNPYDITRSAAGSSNGSGIATAMSFAAATIGTETAGSIIGPSSVNGIVGMKPTIALVSRRGIVPISLNQDSSGPMTRTVRDVAMILDVIAGSDSGDPWSAEADANRGDYLGALDTEALQGARLGVIRPSGDAADVVGGLFDAAIATLSAQGAEIVEISADELIDIRPEMRVILLHDFKVDLNAYFATMPEEVEVRTLGDLIEHGRTDPRENMHTMDLWEDAQATEGGREHPDFVAAFAEGQRLTRHEGIDRLMREYGVAALVTPSGNPASVIQPDGTEGRGPLPEGPRGTSPSSLTTIAAVAGYPLITVPMGLTDGLPVGLSFVGTAWSEASLIGFAYDYEQASLERVQPEMAAGR